MTIFCKRTPASAQRNATAIRKRLERLEPDFWKALRDGDDELATQVAFCGALERNLLLLEFMETVMRDAYISSVKGYVPKATFQPVLTTVHINEYLNMLSGLVSESHALIATPEPNLSAVQLPDRSVRPEVIREVLRACRTGSCLKIIYASMHQPQWHERMISRIP